MKRRPFGDFRRKGPPKGPRWRLAALAAAVLLSVSAGGLAQTVRVGIYENRPKVFTKEDGTPAGIFVDIVEAIARREGWDLRYVHGSWPVCIQRLESGEIDLMMDVAYSPERALKYDFCKDEVICNWAQVYTRRGVEIELVTDLSGMRVSTLREGIHRDRFQELMEGFGVKCDLVLVNSYGEVFRMLRDGTADAGVVNRVFGYANESAYGVVRSPVVFSPASLRFAVLKGRNAHIIEAVDRNLSDMKATKGSTYHQSIRRWLGETTSLELPAWISHSLVVIGSAAVLFLLMSLVLKHEVNRKTARLQQSNRELGRQVEETMKAHLELKRSREKLIRQERLSALGQMASGLAHDFNNMLTPVLGYSDLLLQSPGALNDREQTMSFLRLIRSAAGDARETIKRLQEFQRADVRPKMETFSVAQLVSEVIEGTRPLWKSQKEAESVPISVRQNIQSGLTATGSCAQLREALMNLLLNAVDAMPSGGEIGIRAQAEGEELCLQVQDTGVGMPSRVQERCMEPFYSTKGKKGSGMGLAMVHGIVERHGGIMEIDSRPGKGTSVILRIPFEQKAAVDGRSAAEGPQAVTHACILIVDDDENTRELISQYLMIDGHTVLTAPDAEEGMAAFDRSLPDVVITDWAMPGASGEAVVRHVKARRPDVAVLMVTGFVEIVQGKASYREGVDGFLGKPFTLAELRDALACARAAVRKTGPNRGKG